MLAKERQDLPLVPELLLTIASSISSTPIPVFPLALIISSRLHPNKIYNLVFHFFGFCAIKVNFVNYRDNLKIYCRWPCTGWISFALECLEKHLQSIKHLRMQLLNVKLHTRNRHAPECPIKF